ncbi:MAG: AsnC family transcriptional regulator [Methanocellales archaeon]|nr:AsnC family transcriptional regulator [Methanocellales archaeon]
MDEVDRSILNSIQDRFPLTSRPFAELGVRLGLSEDEVISRIQKLKDANIIRRIAPIIDVKKLGGASTLVAMSVPLDRVDEVANTINTYPEVSHNYLRRNKYNIWFTISAPSKSRLDQMLKEIGEKTGCPYINLPTIRVFRLGVKFEV